MITASTGITVILNASAGSGCNQAVADSITENFRRHGLEVHMVLAASGDEIVDAAERAVSTGCAVVVAGGGDGTVSTVAGSLVGTDTLFGVLPLGTLNHLAKDLHIPLELEKAVDVIARGHTARIDVGEVNGRIFLNNSSLGLYPETVRHRQQQQRAHGRGKWAALFWAAVSALRRYRLLNVMLSVENRQFRRHTPFVFIGNNEYQMEGFRLGARQRLDAGKLSLYVAHRTRRLGLAMLALRAMTGRLREAKDFNAMSAKTILIEARKKMLRVATDGEVSLMQTPLNYSIRPAALKVIVPAGAATTDNL